MVRCVVKTRRMIFVVKNYQVNVPIFFRVQLVGKCQACVRQRQAKRSERAPASVVASCVRVGGGRRTAAALVRQHAAGRSDGDAAWQADREGQV